CLEIQADVEHREEHRDAPESRLRYRARRQEEEQREACEGQQSARTVRRERLATSPREDRSPNVEQTEDAIEGEARKKPFRREIFRGPYRFRRERKECGHEVH